MRRLAAILLLACALPAWACNWFVGPTSAGAANGTSEANRWGVASIGWASMSSGQTLCLSVGTYSGAGARININSVSANYSITNPLIIEGNNQILDCQQATAHCLYFRAAVGIRVQNLTVANSSSSAIRMDGSDGTIGLRGITFVNVTAERSGQCGFQVDSGAYEITVRGSKGRDNYDIATDGANGDGFCTGGSAVTTTLSDVRQILIEDSEFTGNSDDGIDLYGMMHPATIRRNLIANNGNRSGNRRGLVLGYGTGAHIIESNIIRGNGWWGIHRRDNTGIVVLRNNTLSGNGLDSPATNCCTAGTGRNINYPATVDLNFGFQRFADSGVNGEWRALSAPVSSLSVGATPYTLGTVGSLGINQFGNSGGFVFVRGNPGAAIVTATPTTQSTAINTAVGAAGNVSDEVAGLSNGSGGNTWNTGIAPDFLGGRNPTTARGFQPRSTSPLCGAGTYLAGTDDFAGQKFDVPPPIGAWRCGNPRARIQ